MRATPQEILFGVTGQTLYIDCPEGRPSSVTSVSVYRSEDDDTNTALSAVGSPSIESVSTTTTAAAGYDQTDQKAIPLTSVTSVAAGRTYLLAATTGETAWVPVTAISSLTVYSRTPLTSAFASGSTFASTRISATVDATWVATASNLSDEAGPYRVTGETLRPGTDEDPRYRAVWSYVVGGVTYHHETRFDLTRYIATHTITPVDVDDRFPGWIDRLPNDYRRDQGQALIDEAFRAVKYDLLADGHATRWMRRQDVLGELIVYRAQHMAVELQAIHGVVDSGSVTTARDAYIGRYDQLIRAPMVRIGSSPNGGIVDNRPRRSLWER